MEEEIVSNRWTDLKGDRESSAETIPRVQTAIDGVRKEKERLTAACLFSFLPCSSGVLSILSSSLAVGYWL